MAANLPKGSKPIGSCMSIASPLTTTAAAGLHNMLLMIPIPCLELERTPLSG